MNGLRILAATLLLTCPAAAGAQQVTDTLPPDSATVAAGKQIYEGRGLCQTCHGRNGEGMLGPTTRLDAQKKWLHQDGSLQGIIAVITSGVSADKSASGTVMPPRGGTRLTDLQVRQVAAYVQTLHRRKPTAP